MTFEYICFSITNLCNLSCDYCYRIDSQIKCISRDAFETCLTKLKALGCRILNISGGEPLLHNEWRSFIKIAYKLGFSVVLSTNGLLLDLDDKILDYVEEIAIPLDGSNDDINALSRGEGHFYKAIELIDKYRNNNYHFKLKIGTVVTSRNYDDIASIIPLINGANIYWRVFFYKDKGVNNHMNIQFQLKHEDYIRKINELNSIMPSSISFMYECCLEDGLGTKTSTIVSTSSDLYVGTDKRDNLVCNLLKCSTEEIIEKTLSKGFSIQSHKLYFNSVI